MKKLFFFLDKLVDYLVALLMLVLVIVGGFQVFSRYILNYSLTWSEELLRYLLVWLVFTAMGVGLRRQAHIGMNVIVEKFPRNIQKMFGLFTDIIAVCFGTIIIYYTLQLIKVAAFQTTPALGISITFIYYGMVFGGFYTALVGLRFLINGLLTFKQAKDGEK